MRSEDTLIRRENLRRLMDARGWEVADLPAKLGYGRYTYWRDLLEADDKSFGEKAARRIEDAAGLPRGRLDIPEGGPLTATAPTDTLLPLQEGEADLLMFFRLLKPHDRKDILAQIEQILVATHAPLIDVMTRLKLNNRIDDSRVERTLGQVKRPAPPVIEDKPIRKAAAKKVSR